MSSEKQPVYGVIPHYNNVAALGNLLPSMTEQGYDHVFVLDDASTMNEQDKDTWSTLTHVYKDTDITFRTFDHNRGAGATRNRVLDEGLVEKHPKAHLHFIDADTELTSEYAAENVREVLGSGLTGMAGGLITTTEDRQMAFNYGPAFTARGIVSGFIQLRADALVGEGKLQQAAAMRERFSHLLGGWPDTAREPVPTKTAWVAEHNLCISAHRLRSAGRFIERRFGAVQGPAIELATSGAEIRFDPDIATVKHLALGDHPPLQRLTEQLDAARFVATTYGIRRFVIDSWRNIPSAVK
jgi:N-acetylglucosaminyl-diphospho-decaprenol L-rhamnosyltransferase